MGAAGQVLIEYVLLMLVFLLLVGKVARSIPSTFDRATPYLGAKIEQRIETGHGFSASNVNWQPPISPKGGLSD